MTWTPKYIPRHAYARTKAQGFRGWFDGPMVDVRDDIDHRDEGTGISMPIVVIECHDVDSTGRGMAAVRLELDPSTAEYLADALTRAVRVAINDFDWEPPETMKVSAPRQGPNERPGRLTNLAFRRSSVAMPKFRVSVGDEDLDSDLTDDDWDDAED